MPEIVTLAEAKLFLRVDADHEDTLIAMLIGAATETALGLATGYEPDQPAPLTLKLAILTHVCSAYDTRTNVDMPASAMRLLTPHRVFDT